MQKDISRFGAKRSEGIQKHAKSFWKKRVESWRNNEATRPEIRTFEAKDFYLNFNLRRVKSLLIMTTSS